MPIYNFFMTQRYYAPELSIAGQSIELLAEEARHAAKVMRVQIGQQLELFDGAGTHGLATVREVNKRRVTCIVEQLLPAQQAKETLVCVGVAIPKGDRAKFLIEKLTELNVQTIVPLICQHSAWQPAATVASRLQKSAIEACKQSGRNDLPQILAPQPAATWFPCATHADATAKWLAHPGTAAGDGGEPASPQERLAELARASAGKAPRRVAIAIGPEGGFSGDEVATAQATGWQLVDLGHLIQRIETAAIVLASLAIYGE